MKKVMIIFGIFFISILLLSCQKEQLKLYHLSYGDTPSSVNSRIYLKTVFEDSTVSWTSSHPLVISHTGVVTRPPMNESPIDVTLQASHKNKNYTYQFTVSPLTGYEILDLYPGLDDTESIIEIIDYDQLISLLTSKEQALIYLGFESCPWCQEYLPIFHKLAKNTGHEVIYYFNFRDIRTIVDHALNPLFQAIVDLIDEQYLVKNPTNDSLWWLYAPTFIGLKDGMVKGVFTGAFDSHVASQTYLSNNQEEELKQLFRDILIQVKPEDDSCIC